MLLGFVTVVYRLFNLCVCVRVWMIYIEVIVVSEFHAKFMLHSNISNFQQSNRFLKLLLRALGVQILRSIVGPHGGSVISEGVQIFQHYSEVIGQGGPNTSKYLDRGELFQGGPFYS